MSHHNHRAAKLLLVLLVFVAALFSYYCNFGEIIILSSKEEASSSSPPPSYLLRRQSNNDVINNNRQLLAFTDPKTVQLRTDTPLQPAAVESSPIAIDPSAIINPAQLQQNQNQKMICNFPSTTIEAVSQLVTTNPNICNTPPPSSNPDNNKTIILLEGKRAFGRTGNQLIEFLHALQFAHDHDITLGITWKSWPLKITNMWMAEHGAGDNKSIEEWKERIESTFCNRIKIIMDKDQDLVEYDPNNVKTMGAVAFFRYFTTAPTLEDYMVTQGEYIRKLWYMYNTGVGIDMFKRNPVKDMCSGVNALFNSGSGTVGEQRPSQQQQDEQQQQLMIGPAVPYTVIHARSLEGAPGLDLLGRIAKTSNCDPVAALEMRPDYIKSILRPLNMLDKPIILITDGQNKELIARLANDAEIGSNFHRVPWEASWIGGDLTLALLSDVFIGNPASTFSGFIARSRLAFGRRNNYLFRAKKKKEDGSSSEEEDEWEDSCGEECIYDMKIMSYHY